MKNTKKRVALLFALCLVLASLVTVLIASAVGAGDGAEVVTVAYANGTVETFAEGDVIVPIEVPKDFARCDDKGDAYVYTVSEGAAWSFTIDGRALTDMTVTAGMLGKTVNADIAGTYGTEKVWYSVREVIVDETVPEDMRGEFMIYGYDEESLVTYLSRSNAGEEGFVEKYGEPRYRFLRQMDNSFYVTLYNDIYPTKFDPRWGSAEKVWELPKKDSTEKVLCQDRTFRGTYNDDGTPKCSGTSAQVFFNLNGHRVEIGASEAFHFGSMACTPYSMRLYVYSTTPGAVFSGAKSQTVFYSDDDTTIYVGEPIDETKAYTSKYGQNLAVYGKQVSHVNYGGGVYLYGGRYYQVGANADFLNISHRLKAVKNCEFYLADQSEAVLFFNYGQKNGYASLNIENCVFHVNQYGTKLLREVSSQDKNMTNEKPPEEIGDKIRLKFVDCEFYGIPVMQKSCYRTFEYLGDTAYSVGTADNWGTESEPLYISYLKNPTKTRELIDDLGNKFTAAASCALRPASEVACVQYLEEKSYWESGVTPFVHDNVVRSASESYVETEGVYLGLPAVLEAGQTYAAKGVAYNKRIPFAFIYTMPNGAQGFGLAGETAVETGITFASKFGSLSEGDITLLSDIVLTRNVDFGTKGKVSLDLNGYCITVAANATVTGAVHRVGDGMTLNVYSSRPGAVYENKSTYPIYSLAHGGKAGNINLGDYQVKDGELYPGTNVTYISAGSFYLGYPMNKNLTSTAEFRANNGVFIYTGSGAAFRFANTAILSYAKIVLQPKEAGATPIAIATVNNITASVSCGATSFYAPVGVNAKAFAVVNAAGEAVNAASEAQTVNFGNCSFNGVFAELAPDLANVTLTYGSIGFSSIEEMAAFYGATVPAGQAPARGSAEFYIEGKLVYLPVWQYAKPSDTATVTFNSGAANIGSFEETWVKGSIACQPDFIVDGIFVYNYGIREVGASNNRLTAACKSLVSGSMRVNLSFTADMKLNLWIPMNSPIKSLSAFGKTYNIVSTLSYKDSYYIVQIPITVETLSGNVAIGVQTEARNESITLKLASYISGLLENPSVSAEEKNLLYAMVGCSEKLTGTELGLASPQGYVDRSAVMEDAPVFDGAISSVTLDGFVLKVSGTPNATVKLETAGGIVKEAVLASGEASFADLPLWALAEQITLTVGDEVYTYSLGAYKATLAVTKRANADALYTVAYYADKWNAAVKGE